jgi:hypothetical protein
MKSPHKQIAIDLIDLSHHEIKGYKWLFNAVDLFSKYTYSVAMKDKKDTTALNAFKKIHRKIPDLKSVRSDNGSEFISDIFKKYLRDNGIKQILSSSGNPQSNGAIERLNQTLKWLLQKNIQLNLKFDWVTNLPKLVDNINNTVHKETGKTPQEVEDNKDDESYIKEEHDKQVRNKKSNLSAQKFMKGDKVRIYQPSDKFKSLNWSKEVYTVEKVFKPKTDYSVYEYKLEGLNERYLEEDLLKIAYPVMNTTSQPSFYRISRLVRPAIKNNKPHYEVKWVGYRQTTIEPRDQLLQDVPKMINLYEKQSGIEFREDRRKKLYVYAPPEPK